MLTFPKDFVWGSSTSGPQSEGRVAGDGKGENLWDYWYSLEPDRFHGQIGPETTSTFYLNYEKDIDLLLETGHTIFRTSIQWSRLFPQGVGEVNQTALAFYRKVFRLIKDKGIELMVNLYHFDLPFELQKIEGWENRAIVDAIRPMPASVLKTLGTWSTAGLPLMNPLSPSNVATSMIIITPTNWMPRRQPRWPFIPS